MKRASNSLWAIALVATGLFLATPSAHAACTTDKPRDSLTYEDAQAIYDCLKDGMYENYNKGQKRWIPADIVEDYRNWKPASTLPADPGFHSERYLLAYVNPVGYDAYTEFAEDPTIPEGTVIVKESFSITKKGKGKAGPLFIMQKAKAGSSPKTMDWYYMMVSAKGIPQAINVYQACNECHVESFGFQGGLGYPVEEVRVTD